MKKQSLPVLAIVVLFAVALWVSDSAFAEHIPACGDAKKGQSISHSHQINKKDITITLDKEFIERTRGKIENAVLPVMERLYLHDRQLFDDSYRPGLKNMEKIVSYFDYRQCGLSVLASMSAKGNKHLPANLPRPATKDDITYGPCVS